MKIVQILAMVTALISASQSFAEKTGTLRFQGEIMNETCATDVSGSSSTASGASGTVTLPKVSIASLAKVANTAGDTSFNITLKGANGEACDIANTVQGIYFEQNSKQVNADGRLNSTGLAKGFDIRLLTNDKTPINLMLNAGAQQASSLEGNSYKYYAQYYATAKAEDEGIKLGTILSEVDYTIIYK